MMNCCLPRCPQSVHNSLQFGLYHCLRILQTHLLYKYHLLYIHHSFLIQLIHFHFHLVQFQFQFILVLVHAPHCVRHSFVLQFYSQFLLVPLPHCFRQFHTIFQAVPLHHFYLFRCIHHSFGLQVTLSVCFGSIASLFWASVCT